MHPKSGPGWIENQLGCCIARGWALGATGASRVCGGPSAPSEAARWFDRLEIDDSVPPASGDA